MDIPRKSINVFETFYSIEYCIINNKLMRYSRNIFEKKSPSNHFMKINWKQRAWH